MTREEAIKIIDKGLDIGNQMPFLTVDQMNEAKQMAIKALSQQTEYHGTEDMEGLYYCPICQQTTTVVKDGKCPKCGGTMDELSTREQTEDTISRKQAIYIASGFCHPANVADELAKLPSVKPQERDVLDKIKAEIEERKKNSGGEPNRNIAFNVCLQIIDKYRGESEEQA